MEYLLLFYENQFEQFRFCELIYAFLVRTRAGLAPLADSWAVEWERRRSGRLAGHLVGAELIAKLAHIIGYDYAGTITDRGPGAVYPG